MSTKDREKREKRAISAQGMLDSAPSTGNKGTYLKVPQGLKLFMPQENKTYRLVFIPWKAGSGNPSAKKGDYVTNRFYAAHKNVGPNGETFNCSARVFGKPCPICQDFQRLRGQNIDWEKIKDLRPKDRELFLIHDLDGDKNNLMIWDESTHLFGKYLRAKLARKSSYMFFADFEKGKVVEIVGTKKKGGKVSCTEFTSIEIEDREPLSEELIEKASKFCLDDYLIDTPPAKLKEIYLNTGGVDDEDQDEDENEKDESDDTEELDEAEEVDEESEDSDDSDDEETEEEESDDEESEDSNDSDDEETEEEESEESDLDEEEETEDDETEEEDDEPAPPKKTKKKTASTKPVPKPAPPKPVKKKKK